MCWVLVGVLCSVVLTVVPVKLFLVRSSHIFTQWMKKHPLQTPALPVVALVSFKILDKFEHGVHCGGVSFANPISLDFRWFILVIYSSVKSDSVFQEIHLVPARCEIVGINCVVCSDPFGSGGSQRGPTSDPLPHPSCLRLFFFYQFCWFFFFNQGTNLFYLLFSTLISIVFLFSILHFIINILCLHFALFLSLRLTWDLFILIFIYSLKTSYLYIIYLDHTILSFLPPVASRTPCHIAMTLFIYSFIKIHWLQLVLFICTCAWGNPVRHGEHTNGYNC